MNRSKASRNARARSVRSLLDGEASSTMSSHASSRDTVPADFYQQLKNDLESLRGKLDKQVTEMVVASAHEMDRISAKLLNLNVSESEDQFQFKYGEEGITTAQPTNTSPKVQPEVIGWSASAVTAPTNNLTRQVAAKRVKQRIFGERFQSPLSTFPEDKILEENENEDDDGDEEEDRSEYPPASPDNVRIDRTEILSDISPDGEFSEFLKSPVELDEIDEDEDEMSEEDYDPVTASRNLRNLLSPKKHNFFPQLSEEESHRSGASDAIVFIEDIQSDQLFMSGGDTSSRDQNHNISSNLDGTPSSPGPDFDNEDSNARDMPPTSPLSRSSPIHEIATWGSQSTKSSRNEEECRQSISPPDSPVIKPKVLRSPLRFDPFSELRRVHSRLSAHRDAPQFGRPSEFVRPDAPDSHENSGVNLEQILPVDDDKFVDTTDVSASTYGRPDAPTGKSPPDSPQNVAKAYMHRRKQLAATPEHLVVTYYNGKREESVLDKRSPRKEKGKSVIRLEQVHMKSITDLYGEKGNFTGFLVRGKPHGQGTMQYSDGRTYTGEWSFGRWHGFGHASFANGDSYIGEYELDKRHGTGRYEWHDGRVYDGEFVRDQREGQGTYGWPDGSVYAGAFVDGHRHGHGIYKFADGSIYTGMWEKGKYHGVGECVWSDGRCYRGEWANGRAHGYGVETRADGTIRHDGEWRRDRPVRRKTSSLNGREKSSRLVIRE